MRISQGVEMGVVYKLRADIVDFIVQHKRDIPNISCRKLCKIVGEKFIRIKGLLFLSHPDFHIIS